MIRIITLVLLTSSTISLAQAPQIKSGATVYIEPMGGYETYLAAALLKKHVPVVVVTDKAKADFIIASTISHQNPMQPGIVINNQASANAGSNNGNSDAWDRGWNAGSGFPRPTAAGHTDASISVVDRKTSQIVFAYSAGSYRSNQTAKTAEDCAKHLKEFVERSEKPKK